MDWAKRFLIVSLVVFFAALVYSVVSFYQLRQLPELEVIEEPEVPLQSSPHVLESPKVSEKSSSSDSETFNGELALTEDKWEGNLGNFDASSTDESTFTPEPLVDIEEKVSKYPKVPEDYPYKVLWQRPEEERSQIPPEQLGELELLSMAMVKLWSEGDHDFTGGVITNKMVYPDSAYVEWD